MISLTPISTVFTEAILFGARGIGRRRGADTSETLAYMLVAAVVITVVCLALYGASKVRHKMRFNSHPSLFRDLCHAHSLDRGACQLLKQVAAHHKLPHPAQLFTEPQWLDPEGLKGPLRRHAVEAASLRNRLFAENRK